MNSEYKVKKLFSLIAMYFFFLFRKAEQTWQKFHTPFEQEHSQFIWARDGEKVLLSAEVCITCFKIEEWCARNKLFSEVMCGRRKKIISYCQIHWNHTCFSFCFKSSVHDFYQHQCLCDLDMFSYMQQCLKTSIKALIQIR